MQPCQHGGRARDFGRERRDRGMGRREGGLPQKKQRRQRLVGAAHHAGGVGGLDLALDRERHLGVRARYRVAVREIAESIDQRGQLSPSLAAHAPIEHRATLVGARTHAERLDRVRDRLLVAIDGLMLDAEFHALSIHTGRTLRGESTICPA